jgi:type IV pilus assembly protein PilC
MTAVQTPHPPDPAAQLAALQNRNPEAAAFNDVRAEKPKKKWSQIEVIPARVKQEDLMNFSRQAAAFLRAGIPILDCLAVLQDEIKNDKLKKIVFETGQSLRGGSSFAEGLGRYANDFPPYYVPMVRSAELTGRLDDVLDQLAIYIERDLEARRKVKSALTYPAVVASLSVVSVVILAWWVLPKFETFFDSLDAELPLATRLLLGMTGVFATLWPVFLVLFALGVAALIASVRTERGRRIRDRLLLRAPAIGRVVQYAVVERFCRALSALVQAGVPLTDAITVASEGTGNLVIKDKILEAREAMIRGEGLAGPLALTGVFPSGANQMIRVGEETGTLDQQLDFAAGFYAKELDYRLKKFTDLFEPAVIVFMGGIVGFVAIALVSAMYGIFNQVQF